jgi:acetyl esterase/lipase
MVTLIPTRAPRARGQSTGAPEPRFHRGMSIRSRAITLGARLGIKPIVRAWMVAPDLRWPAGWVDAAAALLPRPPHIRTGDVTLPHCSAEWVRARSSRAERAILYLHGGAFLTCGLNTHRALVSCLSQSADALVLNVAYRMLPRHPISSAVSDALDGYRWLRRIGYHDGDIVIAGDSAGGYLAFLTALSITRGLSKPAGVVTISPLTDLRPCRKSQNGRPLRCSMFPAHAVTVFASYLAETHSRITVNGEPAPSLVSLHEEDLSEMPPVMIHVGTDDILCPDAELMTSRLLESGVPCDLHIWQGQMHAFPIAGKATPESMRAIREMGRFVRDVTGDNSRADGRPELIFAFTDAS